MAARPPEHSHVPGERSTKEQSLRATVSLLRLHLILASSFS